MANESDIALASHIDAPTFYGMRLVLFTTLKKLKNDAKARPATAISRENVTQTLHLECLHNEFLQVAGTQEIVSRFYRDLLLAIPHSKLQSFVDSFSDKEIRLIDTAMQSDNFFVKAGIMSQLRHFNAQGLKLGIATLTETFLFYLRRMNIDLSDPMLLGQVQMSPQQAVRLGIMDRDFRIIDFVMLPSVQRHLMKFSSAAHLQSHLASEKHSMWGMKNAAPEIHKQ